MDERTLCTRFKSWIDAELRERTYADLTHADTEVHVEVGGSTKRHDVAIYASRRLVFSFEVRTPQHTHGSSPYDPELAENARAKADAEGLEFFGTFNCASFVLWKTHLPNVPVSRRSIRRWPVVPPSALGRLGEIEAERAFKNFIPKLLDEVARIRGGEQPQVGGAPEDQVADLIEDRLSTIVGLAFPEVYSRFENDTDFRRSMKEWMVQDQQWTWDDTCGPELVLRATQIACYLVMNQVLFYETMRARFRELSPIELRNARSGRGVRDRLSPRFAQAMAVSGDYETVFRVGWIEEVAYAADASAAAWAALAAGVREVDLQSVSLDLLGGIFERLLSPEERHQFGQHYTSPELTDLLVAAAVTASNSVVFDPSSGGGTFLVRAYDRKRWLGESDHMVLLSDIYGNDISRFAGHLSTLNLAVRSLQPEENYPRVSRKDFFLLRPGEPMLRLPAPGSTSQEVLAPTRVNAYVGNPPYVRRQNISREQWNVIQEAMRLHPSGNPGLHELSDLHAYFWVHGTPFLQEGDRLAFLTSSSWLESTSGESLREYLLANFNVLLVAESDAEPWFSEARVRTVATVLQRRAGGQDPDAKAAFVRIRVPLLRVFGPRTDSARWERVDRFLQGILQGTVPEARTWLVPGRELRDGVVPWAQYLRAPDLLVRWRGLGGVKRIGESFSLCVGPKLGGTDYFKLKDITDDVLREERASEFGVTTTALQRKRYRIVRGLEGWQGAIESEFLGRALRSPKDEDSRVISPKSGDLCLFIPRGSDLTGKKVAAYVAHGERHGVHRRVYAGARKPWYSIEHKERGPIIYPHAFQFSHKVFLNPDSRHYTTSPNIYLTPRECDVRVAVAVLNSTWVYLDAVFAAGQVGVEGVIRFGGLTQWSRLYVPLLSVLSDDVKSKLLRIWDEASDKGVREFPPAGNEPMSGWRRELDEAVALAAGAGDVVAASELVDELYRWLREFIGRAAHVEGQAVSSRTGRRAQAPGRRLAEQAVDEAEVSPPWAGRIDGMWARLSLPAEEVSSPQLGLFAAGLTRPEAEGDVRFGDTVVSVGTPAQAEYVRALARAHLAPNPCPIPPAEVAETIGVQVGEFARQIPERVRAALTARVNPEDPLFVETYAVALSIAAERVRAALGGSQ